MPAPDRARGPEHAVAPQLHVVLRSPHEGDHVSDGESWISVMGSPDAAHLERNTNKLRSSALHVADGSWVLVLRLLMLMLVLACMGW